MIQNGPEKSSCDKWVNQLHLKKLKDDLSSIGMVCN